MFMGLMIGTNGFSFYKKRLFSVFFRPLHKAMIAPLIDTNITFIVLEDDMSFIQNADDNCLLISVRNNEFIIVPKQSKEKILPRIAKGNMKKLLRLSLRYFVLWNSISSDIDRINKFADSTDMKKPLFRAMLADALFKKKKLWEVRGSFTLMWRSLPYVWFLVATWLKKKSSIVIVRIFYG